MSNSNLSQLKTFAQSESNPTQLKACLFNLIVYTHEPRRTEYFKKVVDLFKDQFPCRIFFIVADPDRSESNLDVEVLSTPLKSNTAFSCDHMIIKAAGQAISEVPFLILPFFVPDLPIYLLWGQDPTTENAILPHLLLYATRLIFDSECSKNLVRFSHEMLKTLASTSIPMIDMNWARISGWREVLAQTFDIHERVEQLSTASSIVIVYNDYPNPLFFHPETQAIYFQSWLACRLGWKFLKLSKEEGFNLFYETQEGQVHIRLLPEPHQEFSSEGLLRLEITGKNDYHCILRRSSDQQVIVQASNQYQCELPLSLVLPSIDSGRMFMQEMFYQKMSEHYSQMLALISQIK